MSKFVKQYPGVYTMGREAVLAFEKENQSIKERGPVDLQLIREDRVPEEYPGYVGKRVLDEEFVQYQNGKFEPDNRVYHDKEYAMSLGYEGLPVYFTVGMFYAIKPFPIPARDFFTPCNICHTNTLIKQLYQGDTAYCFIDENTFIDITPEEGSDIRSVALVCKGSTYNQKGEICMTFVFTLVEHLKVLEDREEAAKIEPGKAWDAPNWWLHKEHIYTDEDWEFIKDIWRKEADQGGEPRYWEDINIGDEPAWTLEGPLDETVEPVFCNGLGLGGVRTLKKEILDPEIFRTMVRNPKDGIWRMQTRSASFNQPPVNLIPEDHPIGLESDDPLSDPPEFRWHLVNFMGRDFLFRNVHNWFGDHAVLTEVEWGIMAPETMDRHGWPNVPVSPFYRRFHEQIPPIVNRPVTIHALERDVAIVKSQVIGKFVENGNYYIKLGWWIEDIETNVWQEGLATVKVPSRNGNTQYGIL